MRQIRKWWMEWMFYACVFLTGLVGGLALFLELFEQVKSAGN